MRRAIRIPMRRISRALSRLALVVCFAACRHPESGGDLWTACADALERDEAPTSAVNAVRAVGQNYHLACGGNRRPCNPNALPLETALTVQHHQRVRAAHVAMRSLQLPESCRALPE